jgi:hypothetical protein
MVKAANGRSSIHRGPDGAWEGWVSFGLDDEGRRKRKHVRGTTKREVAEKVKRLERQRDGKHAGNRPLTVTEWLDAWIATRVTAGARAKTFEGYRADRSHILRAIGTVRLDRLSAEHVDKLWLATWPLAPVSRLAHTCAGHCRPRSTQRSSSVAAKNAEAVLRISFARRSSAFSFRSFTSSRLSSLVTPGGSRRRSRIAPPSPAACWG